MCRILGVEELNIDYSVYFLCAAHFSYLNVVESLRSRRVAHSTQLCELLRKPKVNWVFKIAVWDVVEYIFNYCF